MSIATKRVWVLALLLSFPPALLAQLRPEVVENAKRAVAQIEVEGLREKASAFAIDGSGYFVTAAGALVTSAGPPDLVELVVDLGAKGRKKPMAQVRRVDLLLGLAWLKIDRWDRQVPGGSAKLDLGNDSGLVEGAQVATLGFPLGEAKADQVSVQTGKITTLKHSGNLIVGFGIDVPYNRGQLGGPVLDREGKVVGVVMGPQVAANQVAAIPVGRLAAFLSAPVIGYGPRFSGVLDFHERSQPQEVSLRVELPPVPLSGPVDVEVVIEEKSGERKVFPARPRVQFGPEFDVYFATFVPLATTSRSFVLTVEYASGAIQGIAQDREIRVGARAVRLADVSRINLRLGRNPEYLARLELQFPGDTRINIEPIPGAGSDDPLRARFRANRLDPGPEVRLKSGGAVTGPISGLEPLALDVDGTSVPVDLSRATTIEVWAGRDPPAPTAIGCTVIARRGKEELGRRFFPLASDRWDGRPPANLFSDIAAHPTSRDRGLELAPLPVMSRGARGAGRSIRPPPMPQAGRRGVPAEGLIGDVVTAGGGRYLLLVLPDSRRLAVFDVNAARIAGHIPLPSADALVAAGAETALIFDPRSKLLESWELKTRTRTAVRPFFTNCHVKNLALGSDSDGPLLVYWQPLVRTEEPRKVDVTRKSQDKQSRETGFFSLIDPSTLGIGRFIEPNVGPVVVEPPAAPQPGEAGMLPMAARFRFIPGPQRALDEDLYAKVSHRVHLRASPDGRVFGIWGERGVGSVALVLDKNTLQCFDMNGLFPRERVLDLNARPALVRVVPGPAADTVFSIGGVFDTHGRRRLERQSKTLLPSNDPRAFLAIGGFQHPADYESEHYEQGRRSCDIFREGNPEPVFTLDNLEEMNTPLGRPEPSDLTLDKRFSYVPAARLLVTIPGSDDCLVLRPVGPLE